MRKIKQLLSYLLGAAILAGATGCGESQHSATAGSDVLNQSAAGSVATNQSAAALAFGLDTGSDQISFAASQAGTSAGRLQSSKPSSITPDHRRSSSAKDTFTSIKPNEKSEIAGLVVKPSYPKTIKQNAYDEWRANTDNNPISEDFQERLRTFSYRTAAGVLSGADGNVNYSPASLYYALALADAGAKGTTHKEFADLLGLSDQKKLADQCGNLYRRMCSTNEYGQLRLANSLWMQQGVPFRDSFIKTAQKDFYASLFQLDLQSAQAKKAMTQWVKENTKATIEPQIQVGSQQIVSLMNTVYYCDEWVDQFARDKTKKEKFVLENKKTVQCDFMHKNYFSHAFYKGEDFTRSYLSMKNGSITFILPDEGVPVDRFLSSAEKLRAVFEDGKNTVGEVQFGVPKISFGNTLSLKDMLSSLGLKTAFSRRADFTGMTGQLAYLDGVTQQTHIAWNEDGIEASAFTDLRFVGAAPPQGKADMILNRPFIFIIQSNMPLFIGVCRNPAA